MQRCPKCGYRDAIDWPAILGFFAFAILYAVFLMAVEPSNQNLRVVALAAWLVFLAAFLWREMRKRKDELEYFKDHPPATGGTTHTK